MLFKATLILIIGKTTQNSKLRLLLTVLFLLCVKINIVIIIKKDKRQRVKKIQNNQIQVEF